jgi:hypothetical protein
VAGTTLGDIMSMGLITGSAAAPTVPFASGLSVGDAAAAGVPEETLAARYGIDHPLDRMALTANGNLQRLVCSYYDSPVTVTLDSQYRRSSLQEGDPERAGSSAQGRQENDLGTPTRLRASSHVWHRVVHLSVFQATFCTATSVITVHDPTCQALVESGRVGLGQLFRYLDLLPEFTLLGAGKFNTPDSSTTSRLEGEASGGRMRQMRGGGGGNFWREYRLDCNELSCSIREEFCPRLWDLWEE